MRGYLEGKVHFDLLRNVCSLPSQHSLSFLPLQSEAIHELLRLFTVTLCSGLTLECMTTFKMLPNVTYAGVPF